MYKEIEKIDFHPFKVSACREQKHTLCQGYKNSYSLTFDDSIMSFNLSLCNIFIHMHIADINILNRFLNKGAYLPYY